MIDAGALRHMCMYHEKQNGKDEDWEKTSQYATREFRDIPQEVLVGLLAVCKETKEQTSRFMLGMITQEEFSQFLSNRVQLCSGNTAA
jgi:hypothetical protein